MIAEHFDAIKARLTQHQILATKVFDVARTGTAGLLRENYVILAGGIPVAVDDERYTAVPVPDSKSDYEYRTRAVGTTPAAVRMFLDAVLTQLVGHRLVVAGRECTPLRVADSGDLTEDKGATPSMYYADIFWETTSSPV